MFVVRSPRASPEPRAERERARKSNSSSTHATSFSGEQRPAGVASTKPVNPPSPSHTTRPGATAAVYVPPLPAAAHLAQSVASTADIEVRFAESDILKVVLDYLQRQGFVRAMRALEKDSSLRCNPAHYPGTFKGALRESVLDGAWESVGRMLVPLLAELEPALRRSVEFQVERQRVVELIARHKGDVDEIHFGGSEKAGANSGLPGILDSLRRVKAVCPTHDEYAELCSLLELPSLRSSECYRTWTPLEGRHNLFLRLAALLAVPLDRLQASKFTPSSLYDKDPSVHHLSRALTASDDAVVSAAGLPASSDMVPVPEYQLVVLLRQAVEHQLGVYCRRHADGTGVDVPDPLMVNLLRSAFDADDEHTIHSFNTTVDSLRVRPMGHTSDKAQNAHASGIDSSGATLLRSPQTHEIHGSPAHNPWRNGTGHGKFSAEGRIASDTAPIQNMQQQQQQRRKEATDELAKMSREFQQSLSSFAGSNVSPIQPRLRFPTKTTSHHFDSSGQVNKLVGSPAETSQQSINADVNAADAGRDDPAQPAQAWDIVFEPPKRTLQPSSKRGRFAGRVLDAKASTPAVSAGTEHRQDAINQQARVEVDTQSSTATPTRQNDNRPDADKSRSNSQNQDGHEESVPAPMNSAHQQTSNAVTAPPQPATAWTIDFGDVAVKSRKPSTATAAAKAVGAGPGPLVTKKLHEQRKVARGRGETRQSAAPRRATTHERQSDITSQNHSIDDVFPSPQRPEGTGSNVNHPASVESRQPRHTHDMRAALPQLSADFDPEKELARLLREDRYTNFDGMQPSRGQEHLHRSNASTDISRNNLETDNAVDASRLSAASVGGGRELVLDRDGVDHWDDFLASLGRSDSSRSGIATTPADAHDALVQNKAQRPDPNAAPKRQSPPKSTRVLRSSQPSASYFAFAMWRTMQPVRAVAFDPLAGNSCAVGTNGRMLGLLDFSRIDSSATAAHAGAHSARGSGILQLGASGPMWHGQRRNHHFGSVFSVAFNSSGKLVATGSNDKTVRVVKHAGEGAKWSSESLDASPSSSVVCTGHDGTVRSVAFLAPSFSQPKNSVGSTHLSSAGSGDCAVRIFDVALAVSRTGNRQQRGPASAPRLATDQICVPLQILSNGVHRAPVFALSAGATPNELFSASGDGTVKLWDLRANCAASTFSCGAQAFAVDYSPRTTAAGIVAVGLHSGAVQVWDVRQAGGSTTKPLTQYSYSSSECRCVRFNKSPGRGSLQLASSNFDGSIHITNVTTGQKSAALPTQHLHTDKVLQVDWHPLLQEVLVSCGADGRVIFWRGSSSD